MAAYKIYHCGDAAITIELSQIISLAVNQQVMALYYHLQQAALPGVRDIIPAYTSLTVVYDIVEIKKHTTKQAFQFILDKIAALIKSCNWNFQTLSRSISIPVCYDLVLAPDLERMALAKKLSIEEIIRIHTGKTYQVYMIGFLPGFPYMGVVDERIVMPRLALPRLHVAAGSIGIVDHQTGIYPLDSPGGWNIIGKTPLKLFDTAKESPCFLQPGDNVQFVAISLQEYNQTRQPV